MTSWLVHVRFYIIKNTFCNIMAKQLNLFGKVVAPSSQSHIYMNPIGPYEKFIEECYQRHCNSTKCKPDFIKEAQKEWKLKFSKDKGTLDAFLKERGERPLEDEQLFDFGFRKLATASSSSEAVLSCSSSQYVRGTPQHYLWTNVCISKVII